MYYYIFEPPLEAKEYERTASIKEYLSSLGIAGEMVTPTQNRTIEDLVSLAVAKRYSTIIAVGSTDLINQVARSLEPHEVVFGIIPTNEHSDLSRLIGVTTWKEAADMLKRRRWLPVRLGLLNERYCFLTPATLQLPHSCSYQLTTDTFSLTGSGGFITISPLRGGALSESSILLEISSPAPRASLFKSLFRKPNPATQVSQFNLPAFELTTSEPTQVVVAGSVLATTPIQVTPQQKALKLIVANAHVEE